MQTSGKIMKKPAMTLVLSMNPFCDHEAEPPCTIYQPVWKPECSGPAHSSSRADTHELHDEPPSRGSTDHVTMSRIAYFKRKYVEDDDLPLNFRSYRRTVSPGLEEQTHVLHLSLDKMRFIDDPEAFLRRSVLINNLLRRLRTEILLQGAWPFMAGSAPVSLTTPVSVHQDRIRKRLRLLHEDEEDECVSACCCFYEASRYMQLPVCVYKRDLQPSSSTSSSQSSSSSAITERLERLFEEDEEEEEDAESEGEEELDSLCPGLDLCEASLKAREGLRERETEGEMMVAVETGQQAALVLAQIGRK
ncbi:SERTA domain-containing protein 4 isoform 2-T2 [Clarias gariepinus]